MKITAFTKTNHTPMNLSNYYHSHLLGNAGCASCFKALIHETPFNGRVLCKTLNSHPDVTCVFSLVKETAVSIVLNAEDVFGNFTVLQIEK